MSVVPDCARPVEAGVGGGHGEHREDHGSHGTCFIKSQKSPFYIVVSSLSRILLLLIDLTKKRSIVDHFTLNFATDVYLEEKVTTTQAKLLRGHLSMAALYSALEVNDLGPI
jgi:hypothetical protein